MVIWTLFLSNMKYILFKRKLLINQMHTLKEIWIKSDIRHHLHSHLTYWDQKYFILVELSYLSISRLFQMILHRMLKEPKNYAQNLRNGKKVKTLRSKWLKCPHMTKMAKNWRQPVSWGKNSRPCVCTKSNKTRHPRQSRPNLGQNDSR